MQTVPKHETHQLGQTAKNYCRIFAVETNMMVKQSLQSLHEVLTKNPQKIPKIGALFVFSIDDPKQNAGSLLTPVSDTVFYALSHGTLGFALHGSSFNHFLIGGNSSTANQIL